jgi:hypothetical protein
MSSKSKGSAKVLPLADILRDLAVLRASETEIPDTLLRGENEIQTHTSPSITASVASSYEFAQAARTAIKLHNSGKVDIEGAKVDNIQKKIVDFLEGLDA